MVSTAAGGLQRWAPWLALLMAAGVGALVYGDYGLAWDERTSHEVGLTNYAYVTGGDRAAFDAFYDRDYGAAIELPLAAMEHALGLDSTREVFRARHLVSHLIFVAGVGVFFLLARFHFGSAALAGLGALMLWLTPRLYGHSFINSKDVPFMCASAAALFTLVRAFERRHYTAFALHGLLCALLINIRIMGVVTVAYTATALLVDAACERNAKNALRWGATFVVTMLVCLYATWPFLWRDPVAALAEALANLQSFRWGGNVLYRGQMVSTIALPPDYAPTWITLTTPPLSLALFVLGAGCIVRDFLRGPQQALVQRPLRNELLYLGSALAPVLAVIATGAVMYDGWRQLFFVYPSMLLVGLVGARWVGQWVQGRPRLQAAAMATVALALAGQAWTLARLHPYPHVYFNALTSHDDQYLRQHYDLDYWGTSYLECLQYIADHDPRPRVHVHVAHEPGRTNAWLLRREDDERLHIEEARDLADADYFVSNHRFHPQDYDLGDPLFTVDRQGSRLAAVWRRHD